MLKNIVKQSIYYLLGIFSRSLVFLLLPLYIHTLTSAEIGLYELFSSISILLAIILPLEITQSIAKLKTNPNLNPIEVNNKSEKALFFTVISFGVFALIGIVLIIIYKNYFQEQEVSLFVPIFSITYLFFNGIFYYLQNDLRWSQKSKEYAYSTFVQSIIIASTTLLLYITSNFGIIGLYISLNLGVIAGILYILHRNLDYLRMNWHWDEIYTLLKFSIPLAISGGLFYLASIIDKWFLSYFVNLEALGRYGVSIKISAIAIFFFQTLQMAVLPIILSNTTYTYRKKNLEITLRFFLIIAFSLTIGLSAVSPELMRLIATKEYYESAILIPFILIGSVFTSIFPFVPGLWLRGFSWKLANIGIFLVILSLIMSSILVPTFSEIGASITFATYGIGYALIMIISSDRVYRIRRNYGKLLITSFLFIAGSILFAICIYSNTKFWIRISFVVPLIFTIFILLTTKREKIKIFNLIVKILRLKLR